MRVARLQMVFNVLMELFNRFGLCTNVGKTLSMACQPCRAIGVHSVEVYGIRMTVELMTHR